MTRYCFLETTGERGTSDVQTREKRSIPDGIDDARPDNNDDVMMNDLSARNAIEKFTVFETGPSGFSRNFRQLIRRQKFSNYTARPSQFSPTGAPHPDILQSVLRPRAREGTFLPRLFF